MPKVRLGYAPTYRNDWFGYSENCRKLREETLEVLKALPNVEIVDIAEAGEQANPSEGSTPNGAFCDVPTANKLGQYFKSQQVDGIIVNPTDFGNQNAVGKLIEQAGVPALVFAGKEPAAKPAPNPDLSRVSDSYCGTLGITAALWRRNLKYRFAGIFFPGDEGLREELEQFTRALSAIKGLQGARIGMVGLRPDEFECCMFSEPAVIRKFKANIVPVDVWPVIKEVKAMADDDAAVVAKAETIRKTAPVIGVHDGYFTTAAKLDLFLEGLAKNLDLNGLAVQEWGNLTEALGINANGSYARLTEAGLPTACETDVLGTLSMILADRVTLGETKPFFIDWTIQHREDETMALAWHGGNCPPSLAADPSKVALRSEQDQTGELGNDPTHCAGQYQFEIKGGPITLCSLVEKDGEWTMLISEGEAVESGNQISNTYCWLKMPHHQALYRAMAENGFTQHSTMVHGNYADTLELVCQLLDIRALRVG